MTSQEDLIYDFGPFKLDVFERRLLKEDVQIPLAPKAFDLLVVLLKNKGRLVERDILMESLWPGTSVEDGNLSLNISLLRKALGDNSSKPKYIETVSKRGYRFIAKIREIPKDDGKTFPNEPKDKTIEQALSSIEEIKDADTLVQAIVALIPHLPEQVREATVKRALTVAQNIQDSKQRSIALNNLAPFLTNELRQSFLVQAADLNQSDLGITSEAANEYGELSSKNIDIAIRALADTPSKVDLLRFSDYADALVDFIKNEKTEKPLTLAIDGAWGMGKTTLMEMIKYQLAGQENTSSVKGWLRQLWSNAWHYEERGFICTALGIEVIEPLRREFERLNKRHSFRVVWFDAWKYDKEGSLWAALVLEILAQVRKQFSIWQRAWFWIKLNWQRIDADLLFQGVIKSMAYGLSLFFLGMLIYGTATLLPSNPLQEHLQKYIGVVGGLGIVLAFLVFGKKAYERLAEPFDLKISKYVNEPNYKERVGFLTQFEEDFKCIVRILTEEGKWPLVVFIDDLDRCAPPKPVEIIEAINTLLDAKHCVFIIGMDAQAVSKSIEAKYKDLKTLADSDAGGLSLGQSFLEKIVQINFRIPRANQEIVGSFIDANLDPHKGGSSINSLREKVEEAERLIEAEQRAGKTLDEAADVIQIARPDIAEQEVIKAKQEVRARSFDDSIEVRDAIRNATPYLKFNPRKIKRFINVFRLQALIANRRGLLERGDVKIELLAKLIIITIRWPDLIEALEVDKDFIERLMEAHKVKEELKQWQISGSRSPDSRSIEYQEVESINRDLYEKSMQAELDGFLGNLRLKRLLEAADLIRLLGELNASDIKELPKYIYLASVSISLHS